MADLPFNRPTACATPYRGGYSSTYGHDRIVDNRRDSIIYHSFLDHYGVQLGDGNMFEWTKDMKGNGYNNTNLDKDIVFVLHPEPLIRAGLDPAMTEGWVYAQVPVETDGTIEYGWKFLKAFDVK